MTDTPLPRYGTFNTRMLASVLDLGVVMLLTTWFTEWFIEYLFGPVNMDYYAQVLNAPDATADTGKLIRSLWQIVTDQHMLERMISENVINLIFTAAYILPFWFRYSTTPGKMLFGLTIRDAATGARMTRKQALERFGGYIVSFIPLTAGFLLIGLNKKRQGLHDMIASTIVIKKPKTENLA